MCGIAAFFGKPKLTKEARDLTLVNMKILGLYNQSRGIHSCGLYLNGEVVIGVDKEKLFIDFISNNIFETPETFPIILHTRQATKGVHTRENAHPFKIGETNPIVMVHNGTIDNIYALCTKYNMKTEGIMLDSKLLGMLVYEHGMDVLEEYTGGAALIWTEPDYPGTGFVYHGSSRRIKNGVEVEERPLFFLETESGIYFSSIEDSLWAIVRGDEVPKTLNHNHVFEIIDGAFTGRATTIVRGDVNVYSYTGNTNKSTGFPKYGGTGGSNHYEDYDSDYDSCGSQNCKVNDKSKNEKKEETTFKEVSESLVWRETRPKRANKEKKIYFHKGRYFYKGELVHGKMMFTNKGIESETGGLPYWFWNGIMLSGEAAYNTVKRFYDEKLDWMIDTHKNYAWHMSNFSFYPVTNSPDEGSDLSNNSRFRWYIRRSLAMISFTPKFSARSYIIESGFLININSNDRGDKTLHLTLNDAIKAEDSVEEEEVDSLEKLAEMVEDAGGHPQQKPFRYETDGGEDQEGAFDRIYDTVEEVMEFMGVDEVEALKNYVMDYLMIEEKRAVIDDHYVNQTLVDFVAFAVKNQCSIRTAIGDEKTRTLENYLFYVKELNKFPLIRKGMDIQEEESDEDEAPEDSTYFNDGPFENRDEDIADYSVFARNRSIQARLEYDEEYEETIEDHAVEVVTILQEFIDKADELQGIDESDAAQEIAHTIYSKVDEIKVNLHNIFAQHNLVKAKARINEKLNYSSNGKI